VRGPRQGRDDRVAQEGRRGRCRRRARPRGWAARDERRRLCGPSAAEPGTDDHQRPHRPPARSFRPDPNDARRVGRRCKRNCEETEAHIMGNPFVHVEPMSTDVAKARAFYGKLFDWKLEAMPMPDGAYTMIKVGDGTGGGLMKTPIPG